MYFKTQHIDHLYSTVMNPIGETVSLCHHCHKHVPALRYTKDNRVYIAKYCEVHGIMHNMIESDYEFFRSLKCVYAKSNGYGFYNSTIMIEVTDRCNLQCPHCYHIPNNLLKDRPLDSILKQCQDLKERHPHFEKLVFAGAECTIRKDFTRLIFETKKLGLANTALTNGVKLADRSFTKNCIDAGLNSITVGLNHPTYIDSQKVREKQEAALNNATEMGMQIGGVSYTMNSYSELPDIIEEIVNTNWTARLFRIRYGSDIGTNPGQPRMFLSDLYKSVAAYCNKKGYLFEELNPMDNNIYHVVVSVEGKAIRLIQWCDETDIDMEFLKSGPWCDFVGDGVTNFLHQVIRRDISKNNKIQLPDTPPERYLFRYEPTTTELDLYNLK